MAVEKFGPKAEQKIINDAENITNLRRQNIKERDQREQAAIGGETSGAKKLSNAEKFDAWLRRTNNNSLEQRKMIEGDEQKKLEDVRKQLKQNN